MTTYHWVPTALLVLFGLVGAANIILGAVFLFGRWTQKVEMAKLSWDFNQILTEIKDLRTVIHGRFATLEDYQRKDHDLLRGLLTWKAELTTERAIRAKQSEEVRTQFRTELERLKALIGIPTRREHGHD